MKRISQAHFDDTVKTNIELFDSSIDEAIKDAVELFVAEGVDLSYIVKDSLKHIDGHPSALALDKIKNSIEDFDLCDISNLSKTLKQSTDSKTAVQRLLFDLGALDTLLGCFERCFVNTKFADCIVILNCLNDLVDGQANLLTESHIKKMTQCLSETLTQFIINGNINDPALELITNMYKYLQACCNRNETNRIIISKTDVIAKTLESLTQFIEQNLDLSHNTLNLVMKEGCSFLRLMTVDDDMEVEFGYGSENARLIAEATDCLETFVKLIEYALHNNLERVTDIFLTLSVLITREDACKRFASLNGIDMLLIAIHSNTNYKNIALSGLALLRTLCGSDKCKEAIGNWHLQQLTGETITGPQLIVGILEQYIQNTAVVRQATAAIAALTLRQPEFAKAIVHAGAPDLLCKSLELHSTSTATMRSVCLAIRNCICRSPELRSAFLGTENETDDAESSPLVLHLNTILKVPQCSDEAKAALRDLGCKVQLNEPWKAHLKV